MAKARHTKVSEKFKVGPAKECKRGGTEGWTTETNHCSSVAKAGMQETAGTQETKYQPTQNIVEPKTLIEGQ